MVQQLSNQLEFRVVQGVQVGATMKLDLGVNYVIGSSQDNDVVLLGPRIQEAHVSVSVLDAGFVAQAQNGEIEFLEDGHSHGETLPFGTIIKIGSAYVTVDWEFSPWPSLDDLADKINNSIPLQHKATKAFPDFLESIPYVLELGSWCSRHKFLSVFILFFVASIWSFIIFTQWHTRYLEQQKQKEVIEEQLEKQTAIPLSSVLLSLRGIVFSLGLKHDVKVSHEDKKVFLKGYVETNKQENDLKHRVHEYRFSSSKGLDVAKITITVDVCSDEKIMDFVRSATKKITKTPLRFTNNKKGKIFITGDFLSIETISDLQKLKKKNTCVKSIVVTSVQLSDFKKEISKLMLEHKVDDVELKISKDKKFLEAVASLKRPSFLRWKKFLIVLRERYHNLDSFFHDKVTEKIQLTLQIRSIVDGNIPFVVLNSGEKMFVGSTEDGTELTGIDNGHATFLKRGKKFIVP